jgi:hypothetical protein
MTIREYLQALGDRQNTTTAIRVALIIGTLLFCINHGNATLQGEMTRSRWISVLFTYLVPYCVSVHGQTSSRIKSAQKERLEQEYEKQATITH